MSSARAARFGGLCWLAGSCAAVAEPTRLDYTVTWGSITIGRVEVTAERGEGRYRLQSRAQTLGILGFFAPLESVSVTEGTTSADGRAIPASFTVESRWRDEQRRLALTLSPNGRVLTDERIEPQASSEYRHEPVPTALQQGPDPLAQVLTAVMQAAPERTLRGRVYDGRRVVDATLACGAAESKPSSSAATLPGPVFPCTLAAELVAGGRRDGTSSAKPLLQGPARLWLTQGAVGEGAWPVRMELDTRFGMVVAEPDRPPTKAAEAVTAAKTKPPG